MGMTFQVVCFDARGRSRPCRMTLESGGLALEPEAGSAVRWPYPALAAEAGGDDLEWVFLSCPAAGGDIARLAVRETDVIDEIAAHVTGPARDALTGFHGARHRHRARDRRGLAAGFAAAALLATAGWLLLTRLAPDIAADSIPPASERILGDPAAERLIAGHRKIADGPAVDAVRAITERLVAAVEKNPGYAFDVQLVHSDMVNAAALPGGRIVVYSGLLAEAGSAEEVAGVLAHEICHVLHRDSVRQLVRRLGGVALIRLLLGGGDLGGLAARAGELDHLAYGREQERAADRGGVELLARAGIEPGMLPVFFERLQKREGGKLPEFMSTHPDTAERIVEVRRLAAATPVPDPSPLDIDWAAVRASLGGE